MNTQSTQAARRPIVPEDLLRGPREPRNLLVKTAAALVRGRASPAGHETAATELYPNDRTVDLLTKAASSPATTTSGGWAAMASGSTTEFVSGLTAASSGLIARAGVRIVLGRGVALTVPAIVTAATGAGFVAEGQPIRVVTPALGGPTLAPRKLAIITQYSRELARHTEVAAIVRATLDEAMSLALDAAILGAAAQTDSTPGGLLNGVTPITATAGGGTTAMLRDIGALANAISPVSGSNIILIAAPGEAVKLQLFANPALPFPILASNALAAGTVVAIAPAALAVGVDSTPEFVVSTEAVVHQEDTTPLQISTAPSTVASPTRSMFQTDTIALRLILGLTWAMRAPGGIARVNSVTW